MMKIACGSFFYRRHCTNPLMQKRRGLSAVLNIMDPLIIVIPQAAIASNVFMIAQIVRFTCVTAHRTNLIFCLTNNDQRIVRCRFDAACLSVCLKDLLCNQIVVRITDIVIIGLEIMLRTVHRHFARFLCGAESHARFQCFRPQKMLDHRMAGDTFMACTESACRYCISGST